ncbi:hypothetical protein AOQ84DRAFT_393170, partial [Glonium stellatum]
MRAEPKHPKESTLQKGASWFRNACTLVKLPKESELREKKKQERGKISFKPEEAQWLEQVRSQGPDGHRKAITRQLETDNEENYEDYEDDEDEDERKLRLWIERKTASRQRWNTKIPLQDDALESEKSVSSIELTDDESNASQPLFATESTCIHTLQRAPRARRRPIRQLYSSTGSIEPSTVSKRISLTGLPNELLDDILQRVRKTCSFRRFRGYLMVCKRLYIVGLPVLYQEIFYSSITYYSRYPQLPELPQRPANSPVPTHQYSWDEAPKASHPETNHMPPSPYQPLQPYTNFAKHIRSFTLAFDWQHWLDAHFTSTTTTPSIAFLTSLAHLLPLLQNLTFLSLIATPVYS